MHDIDEYVEKEAKEGEGRCEVTARLNEFRMCIQAIQAGTWQALLISK